MSAPAAALRPPLRASGIAFAPAPSLRQSKGRKGGALSGSEAAEDRQQGRGRKAVTARNRRRAGSCRAAVLRENDGQGCAGVVAAGKSACPPCRKAVTARNRRRGAAGRRFHRTNQGVWLCRTAGKYGARRQERDRAAGKVKNRRTGQRQPSSGLFGAAGKPVVFGGRTSAGQGVGAFGGRLMKGKRRRFRNALSSRIKRVGGRGGGLGEGLRERLSFGKAGPLCASQGGSPSPS